MGPFPEQIPLQSRVHGDLIWRWLLPNLYYVYEGQGRMIITSIHEERFDLVDGLLSQAGFSGGKIYNKDLKEDVRKPDQPPPRWSDEDWVPDDEEVDPDNPPPRPTRIFRDVADSSSQWTRPDSGRSGDMDNTYGEDYPTSWQSPSSSWNYQGKGKGDGKGKGKGKGRGKGSGRGKGKGHPDWEDPHWYRSRSWSRDSRDQGKGEQATPQASGLSDAQADPRKEYGLPPPVPAEAEPEERTRFFRRIFAGPQNPQELGITDFRPPREFRDHVADFCNDFNKAFAMYGHTCLFMIGAGEWRG